MGNLSAEGGSEIAYWKPKVRRVTLVEVILTMTILALLMAAVGVAVQASIGGFTENEKVARAMQAARCVLDRMARQVRTAEGVDFTQTVEGQYNVTTLIVTSPRDGSGLADATDAENSNRLSSGQRNCLGSATAMALAPAFAMRSAMSRATCVEA